MKISDVRRITENGWKPWDIAAVDEAEYAQKFEKVMKDVPSFTLVTSEKDGMPQARAMSLKANDGLERIWFATHRSSEHAGHIMSNPVVTVLFNNTTTFESLVLTGKAHVETDKENMKKCWREFYKDTFKKGFDDPEYLPLRIEFETGYYNGGGVKVKFTVE